MGSGVGTGTVGDTGDMSGKTDGGGGGGGGGGGEISGRAESAGADSESGNRFGSSEIAGVVVTEGAIEGPESTEYLKSPAMPTQIYN